MPSLQQLENKNWGNPDAAPTYLTKRCIELTKIPIEKFSIEDLRIMIGQDLGLAYLIPLAIEKLKANILAEGDLYPGDLLNAILKTHRSFWEENKPLLDHLHIIIKDNMTEIEGAGISLKNFPY